MASEKEKRTRRREITCLVCGTPFNPAKKYGRHPAGFCPRCRWGGGEATSDEDPKYLVLLSLVNRALEAGQVKNDRSGAFVRIDPSPREYAILEHGDQLRVGETLWRISAKKDGYFYLRYSRVEKRKSNDESTKEFYTLRNPLKEPEESGKSAGDG